MRQPTRHRKAGALRLLLGLVAVSLVVGCKREVPSPVAPFGGALATELPSHDVLGFLRFRPDDPVARRLVSGLEQLPQQAALFSIAGPPLFVLREALTGDQADVPAPLVVLFLDPSVHGAFCGFAWRGSAQWFRAAAARRGLRLEDDEVWLPGRGRIAGLEELVGDAMRIHVEGGADGDPSSIELPATRYHLVEREVWTLLLPARDGVANVLAALHATQVLDPATGDGICLRFELGAALGESKHQLRDRLQNLISESLWGAFYPHGWDRNSGGTRWETYGQLSSTLQSSARNLIDALISIDHLFLQVADEQGELYLRAEAGGLLEKLLPILRNQPLSDLVAGAPNGAPLVVAASVTPAALDALPSLLSERRGPSFVHRSRGRRAAAQATAQAAEDEAEAAEGRFLDSFSGRFWLATSVDSEASNGWFQGTLERLGGNDSGSSKSVTNAASGAPPITLRLFAELTNDETNEGLLTALLSDLLPASAMSIVRVAALAYYGIQRMPGGCMEVVGGGANALLMEERQRLLEPGLFDVPFGAAEEAALFASLREPGGSPIGCVTVRRDDHGIRVTMNLRRP